MDQHYAKSTDEKTLASKKPYTKPGILETSPLEAVAVICTPGSPDFGKAPNSPCIKPNS
jgi:hypothetical protein